MSLKNYSDLINLCYKYIRYDKTKNEDLNIEKYVKSSLDELQNISQFKYIYSEYTDIIPILNKEPYIKYFNGSKNYFLVATTLGILVDKRINQLMKINMPYAIVFNSCAAAYLEYLADNYEYNNLGNNLSYRFCPGYGGSSVSDLIELSKYLKLSSIGIEIFDSGMMLPEKSMFGIVAKNGNEKKSCDSCKISKKCEYKKEGKTCYN